VAIVREIVIDTETTGLDLLSKAPADLQNPRRRTKADHHDYVAGDGRVKASGAANRGR